jgi:hypothetical protein
MLPFALATFVAAKMAVTQVGPGSYMSRPRPFAF